MNLHELRKKIKKTQALVADEIQITRRAYSSYENGEREPSLETLCKLADYFEVTVDALLGRVPEQDLFDDARIPKTEIQEVYDELDDFEKAEVLAYAKGIAKAKKLHTKQNSLIG